MNASVPLFVDDQNSDGALTRNKHYSYACSRVLINLQFVSQLWTIYSLWCKFHRLTALGSFYFRTVKADVPLPLIGGLLGANIT